MRGAGGLKGAGQEIDGEGDPLTECQLAVPKLRLGPGSQKKELHYFSFDTCWGAPPVGRYSVWTDRCFAVAGHLRE